MTNEHEPSQPAAPNTSSASASPSGGSSSEARNVNTGGGTYVEGDQRIDGISFSGNANVHVGTIVGQMQNSTLNQTSVQGERSYNVPLRVLRSHSNLRRPVPYRFTPAAVADIRRSAHALGELL